MKRTNTIKDIAKKLKLNISTVSRALNDFPNIKEETKKKVIKAAKELDYCPNHIAKGLIGKNTKVFALITPVLNPHVLPIIRGVTDACRKTGDALMLFPNDYWSNEVIVFSDIKRKWLVDGMIIYNVVYHKKIPQDILNLKKQKIPFVFINKFSGRNIVNNTSIDNIKSVFKIISHLYKLGHRNIGIINGNLSSVDGVDRFSAFKKSLKKLNLKYNEKLVGVGDYGEEIAYNEMKRILSNKQKLTAMFCASDLMAIGCIRAIKDSGLKVPKDIAVCGFDDIALGRYLHPSLTTLRAPLEEVGKKSVSLLKNIIVNPKMKPKEVLFESELIIREST